MTQRTDKVSSLIKQIVAAELLQIPESAYLTVTKVDVTPDLRHATAWVGVVARHPEQANLAFKATQTVRASIQDAIARRLTSKFVPRLVIKRDEGGEYADEITRLIRGL